MMLPFFFLFTHSFVLSSLCFYFLFNFCLPSILLSSVPSVLPSYHIECCVILAFFLSQNKINLSTLHFSLRPSLPPSPVFLWSCSSAETTGELLLKSTDRSTVKRNKRKDRFFLLKPQKLKWEKTAACHCTVGDHFLTINNTARSGGGGERRVGRERPWERAAQPMLLQYRVSCLLPFVYCFSTLSLSVLPSLWACPFLSAAGHRGWSQTNSN